MSMTKAADTAIYTDRLSRAISEEEWRKHRSRGDMYWYHKGVCEGLEKAMALLMETRKKDTGGTNG